MVNKLTGRQRTRKAMIIVAFLAFPIVMNYLSPYVIIEGAFQRTVNGSLIMFGLMFLSSLFLGRLWCGWVCPAAGINEIAAQINDQPLGGQSTNRRRADWIKWLIWLPWVAIILFGVISSGGYQRVDFFFYTVNGISVAGDADRPIAFAYLIYYIVVGLFFGLALVFGRRAGCHTICWMAPFMILGRALRNRFGWASLRLQAEPAHCKDCLTCTTRCPMSLDVHQMVRQARMEHPECILCGSCVDGCSKKAIVYTFRPERPVNPSLAGK